MESLTKDSGNFLLFRCTVKPLDFFSVVSRRALRYLSSSFWSAVRTLPNHFLSGWILPTWGSVGVLCLSLSLGLSLYMLIRLMVARVRNCDPFLPPVGSGLYGFAEFLLWVNALPPPFLIAAMAVVLLCVKSENFFIFDVIFLFTIF